MQVAWFWRILAIVLFVLGLVSLIGNIYQACQPEIVPYIIEINENGHVRAVGKLEKDLPYNPTEAAIKYFLTTFLKNIRSLSTDPVVLHKNYESAYGFVTPRGKILLDEHIDKFKPQETMQRMAISVEVASINTKSDNTYIVEWVEKYFDVSGTSLGDQRFSGVFNIVIKKPTSQTITINPLSIYVDYFSFSKENI
jgi:type IV secretion system protein VirB5